MTDKKNKSQDKATYIADVKEQRSTPETKPVRGKASIASDGFADITYTAAKDYVVGQKVKRPLMDPWHRRRSVWDPIHKTKELTGAGIKIAILDSGIAKHRSLKTPTVRKSYRDGAEPVVDYPASWIENMHGTHVASIAAGQDGLGAAPGAELMDYQVLYGREGSGHNVGIAAAIYDAVDDGADIINMSLGSNGDFPIDERVEAAMIYAIENGCYVFAAAGNSGFVAGRNSVDNPGRSANSIAVAAIRSDGTVAGFSGGGDEVDMAAPGENITGADFRGGVVAISGTSMACPDAAGTCAIALERSDRSGKARPKTLAELIDLMVYGAIDGGAPGEGQRFGKGIPRVDKIAENLSSPDVTAMNQSKSGI